MGALIVWTHSTTGNAFASAVAPLGTIWVDALRMTVVPLVVSLLISTFASSGGVKEVGQLGARTLVVFLALLVGIAIVGLALAIPTYSMLHVDPVAAAELRASTGAAPTSQPPGFASWVTGLVPANVVKAAADGAMLPLLVFAILFGLALAESGDAREPLVRFFRGIAAAMLAVVRWVLLAAPLGAFALAVTVTTHLGNATASIILFYLVTHAALLTIVGLMLYVVIPLATRTPLSRFARALAPAQVVVVATRSSLAALPAMLDGARRGLNIRESTSSVVLPLGVSLLRANTGLSYVVYALFLGKLYGIPLSVAQLVGVAAIGIVMSFAVPGIPSGGLLIATPYFTAVGLPPQGIGILIALDAIPDIFKTLVIVTSHMSATLVLDRWGDATS